MISVIVPARNAADTIGQCILAIGRQTVDRSKYEIIVVDDGSADRTAEAAELAGARVIRRERGRPAMARNTGLAAAVGEIVCFTDADCIPAQDWLAEILAPLADPEIVGCKGVYATDQRELVARFVQIEYEDKYDRLRLQEQIDFVDTYSAAYRREVLLANDGFDRAFPYLEDQELSFRLAAKGYKMVFQPSAVVSHRHSRKLSDYFRKKLTIGYWKARVVRRFPQRGIKDSHTPQVMKVQMVLVAIICLAAALVAVFPRSAVILLVATVSFFLTTVPFAKKAWSKDRQVALAAPFLLGVRAFALALGYCWGTFRPDQLVDTDKGGISGLNYIVKRAIDVVGSMFGLLLLVVLMPFIALAIWLTSDGPIICRQERAGQAGRTFMMYEFSTTRPDSSRPPGESIRSRDVTKVVAKAKNARRLTPAGRLLRRWRLEHLPQFWNVLRGDMSLVGPRPEETHIVTSYTDYERRRLAVRPGVSGPVQVSRAADLPLDNCLEAEIDYIQNYSVWRDLALLTESLRLTLKGPVAQ